MSTFVANVSQPTEASRVLVENKLPVGDYRFQLVVENDKGIQSVPVVHIVTVQRPPTTVIR